MKNVKKNIDKGLIGVFILIILFVIVVNTIVSSYTVLVADDFGQFNQASIAEVGILAHIKNSFLAAKTLYMTWQGTFSSSFLLHFLNPSGSGSLALLRTEMIIFTFLFWLLFALFIKKLIDSMVEDNLQIKWGITCFFVLTLATSVVFEDIFTWFTGAVVYLLPIVFNFFSLLLLMENKSQNKKLTLISMVFAFLGGGGSLIVTAFNCALWIWVMVIRLITEKEFKSYLWTFGASFLSAIINVLAPGNFHRQTAEQGSSSTSLLVTIQNTIEVFISNEKWFLIRRDSLIFLFVVCVLAYFIKNKGYGTKKKYCIFSILLLFMPLVLIFPVVLGYGVPWLPRRCVFVVTLAMTLTWGNFAFILGSNLKMSKVTNVVLCSVGCLVIVLCSFNQSTYKDMAICRLSYCLKNKVFANYYQEYEDMLEYLQEQKGKDVVLPQEVYPKPIEYFFCFQLSENSESFVNKGISRICGINSLVIESIQEE